MPHFNIPNIGSIHICKHAADRTIEWVEFAAKVATHIQDYTVPQYGDKGEDRVTEDEPRDLIREIKKYVLRFGNNKREGQDELDLIKIAHYACMAHAKMKED